MTDALFVDVYPGDGVKDWLAYTAAGPPWHGAIFKLSQGIDYSYATWALRQRAPFLASPRYGRDLWDGFYHYLTFHQPGAAQADFFWTHFEGIGGERTGTLWAMVDVERGGQRIPNPSRAQVEDVTRAFAARYEQRSGRKATLYGGELLRSVGVTDLLGCARSAVALYTDHLGARGETTEVFLARTGTSLDRLMLWQYAGDGAAHLPGYPHEAPGCGKVDISVLTLPGGLDALRAGLWAEQPAAG